MELDINTLRSVVTVLSFVTFIGILYWTLSKQIFRKLPSYHLSRTDFN
jgi:hypothetical protein